jgi:fatty acid CoA ligase FadD9
LIDLPDLGFTSKDSPFPRGEIIVKTPVTSKGYYRLLEETNKSFIDGYFTIFENRSLSQIHLW